MLHLIRELKAEFIKYRGTLVYWLMILCPFAIAFLLFLGMSMGTSKLVANAVAKGKNPWEVFITVHYRVLGIFFLPLYIAMVNGMIYAREHRHNTWKHLYTLPIPGWSIELSKNIFSLLINFTTVLIFALYIFLSGYIISLIKPHMNFMDYNPMIAFNLLMALKIFLASFSIWVLHNWLARRFSNFGLNIGVALLGVVSAGLMLQGWKHVQYFLYALPIVSVIDAKNMHTLFTHPVLLSIISGSVVWVISFWEVQRRKVKA
ncbi:ABC transporter permease [Microscilla marina]|uniref:Membrane protein, putative n=1 Tax=Microscilla marina ATCC 23134 TaxID=313606 RepID=A1ZR55_MICM2|nr:ABC transporter permease [Microscilla marina]EAY27144.1 membrane protein, putative [Microscilla marina ATCC 23134]